MKSIILTIALLLLCAVVYAQNTSSDTEECLKKCTQVTPSKRHLVKRNVLADFFEFIFKFFGDLVKGITVAPGKIVEFLDGFFGKFSTFHRGVIETLFED